MKNNSGQPTWTYSPVQINSVSINDDGSRCVYGTSFERGKGFFATYLIDGNGSQLWKNETASTETVQGVFWVDISGNGNYVASGGELSHSEVHKYESTGFLKAYSADTGAEVLNVITTSRVNQVSLSKDGQYLAACYGNTLEVYKFNASTQLYDIIATETSTNYNINSCKISRNGNTVVASGIQYNDSGGTTIITGKVFSYGVSDKTVTSLGDCELSTGCMRVAIVDSGLFWAASLHDGSCMMFNYKKPDTYEWQYKPDNPDLTLAYAVDITQTETGDIFVACGANLSGTGDGGFLYLIKSVIMVYSENTENLKYPDPKYSCNLQWSTPIKYGVNPGVSLDKNATFVSATDGKPDGNSVQESAGSFYLYSATTGDLVWQYDTVMMNWPMMLARDGKSVFGGSDDGTVYYWTLDAN